MKLTRTTFLLGCLVGGGSAALMPLLFTNTHADTKLLPFQGRLTDASGAPIADGAKVVEFKMYDAPTGGNVKWVGEVHKLSVNGGLVNTMLGSKASLGSVDFSAPIFLQITVDANGDGQISADDPPLLPRQSVIGAVYAAVAGEIQYNIGGALASVKGSEVFDASGKIKASSIAANNAIMSDQIAANAVDSSEIKDGSIASEDLSVALSRDSVIPSGTISAFGGPLQNTPPGWLHCDGAAVSRTLYARLFARIGSSWGSGDGSSTFNLPDLQGVFLRGVDGGRNLDPDKNARSVAKLGGNSGNAVGSLQLDALKDHFHAFTSNGNSDYRRDGNGRAEDWTSPNNTWTDRTTGGVVGPGIRVSTETRPVNAYVIYLIKD